MENVMNTASDEAQTEAQLETPVDSNTQESLLGEEMLMIPDAVDLKTGKGTNIDQAELERLKDLDQRERDILNKEIRYEARNLLAAHKLPEDPRVLDYVVRNTMEETQKSIDAFHDIVAICTEAAINHALVGKTPRSSSGSMRSLGSDNLRDQVKTALR